MTKVSRSRLRGALTKGPVVPATGKKTENKKS